MSSRLARLRKLNKEATPPPWPRPATIPEMRGLLLTDANAELIVECRNSLPAVLNLIEAAQRYEEALAAIAKTARWYADNDARLPLEVDHALCVEILSEAESALDSADEAVAVFVSGQEEPT